MNPRAILLAVLLLPMLPQLLAKGYEQVLYPYPVPVYALPPGYKPVKQDLALNGTHYLAFAGSWGLAVPANGVVSGGGGFGAAAFTNGTHVIAYYEQLPLPKGASFFKAVVALPAVDASAYTNSSHLIVYALAGNDTLYVLTIPTTDAGRALQSGTPLTVNATACEVPGASRILDAGPSLAVTDAGLLFFNGPQPVLLNASFTAASEVYSIGDYICYHDPWTPTANWWCSLRPIPWLLAGTAVITPDPYNGKGFMAFNGTHVAVYYVAEYETKLYLVAYGVHRVAPGPAVSTLRMLDGGDRLALKFYYVAPADLVDTSFNVTVTGVETIVLHPASTPAQCSVVELTVQVYQPDSLYTNLPASTAYILVQARQYTYPQPIPMNASHLGAARVYGPVVVVEPYLVYVVTEHGVVGVSDTPLQNLLIVNDEAYQLPFEITPDIYTAFTVDWPRAYIEDGQYTYEVLLSGKPIIARRWVGNALGPGIGYGAELSVMVWNGTELLVCRRLGGTVLGPLNSDVVREVAARHPPYILADGVFVVEVGVGTPWRGLRVTDTVTLDCPLPTPPAPDGRVLQPVNAPVPVTDDLVFKPVFVEGPGSATWGVHLGPVSLLPLGPKPNNAVAVFNETEWKLTITFELKTPVLIAFAPGSVRALAVDGQPVCTSVEECEALRDPSGLIHLDPFTVEIWLNPDALMPPAAHAAPEAGALGGHGLALPLAVALAAALATATRGRRSS